LVWKLILGIEIIFWPHYLRYQFPEYTKVEGALELRTLIQKVAVAERNHTSIVFCETA